MPKKRNTDDRPQIEQKGIKQKNWSTSLTFTITIV